MAPELIVAAEARRYGWNRQQTRVHLSHWCPTFTEAEIDRELDKIYNHCVEKVLRNGATSAPVEAGRQP